MGPESHGDSLEDGRNLNLKRLCSLPVLQQDSISSINKSIHDNQTVVITGRNGSGKTSFIPQIILDEHIKNGTGASTNILVALSSSLLVQTMAEFVVSLRREQNTKPDERSVGYSTLFAQSYPRSYGSICYCTYDDLIYRFSKGLSGITHVILDDIQERSIEIDFCLAYFQKYISANTNVKLILLSTELDTTAYSNYFACPNITINANSEAKVESKSVQYLEDFIENSSFVPSEIEHTTTIDNSMHIQQENVSSYKQETIDALKTLKNYEHFELVQETVIDVVMWCHKQTMDKSVETATVLFFLPSEYHIKKLTNKLKQDMKFTSVPGDESFNFESIYFYSVHENMSSVQLEHIYTDIPSPSGDFHVNMRVIFCTSMAQARVSVPNVTYVVDCCMSEQTLFDEGINNERIKVCYDSKEVLDGRSALASTCIRLITKAKYESLNEKSILPFTNRSLHKYALQCLHLKINEPHAFFSGCLNPPPTNMVVRALQSLVRMNAVNSTGNITEFGKKLARLPVCPNIGHALITACVLGVGEAANILLASLLFPSIFQNSLEATNYVPLKNKKSDSAAVLYNFSRWDIKLDDSELAAYEFAQAENLNHDILHQINDAQKVFAHWLINEFQFHESIFNQNFKYQVENGMPVILWSKMTVVLMTALHSNIALHDDKQLFHVDALNNGIPACDSVCSLPENVNQGYTCPFFMYHKKYSYSHNKFELHDLTMVSPSVVLIFGSNYVHWQNGISMLDNWAPFGIEFKHVSKLANLRKVHQNLLSVLSSNPSMHTQQVLKFRAVIEHLAVEVFNMTRQKKLVPKRQGSISNGTLSPPPPVVPLRLVPNRQGSINNGTLSPPPPVAPPSNAPKIVIGQVKKRNWSDGPRSMPRSNCNGDFSGHFSHGGNTNPQYPNQPRLKTPNQTRRPPPPLRTPLPSNPPPPRYQ